MNVQINRISSSGNRLIINGDKYTHENGKKGVNYRSNPRSLASLFLKLIGNLTEISDESGHTFLVNKNSFKKWKIAYKKRLPKEEDSSSIICRGIFQVRSRLSSESHRGNLVVGRKRAKTI